MGRHVKRHTATHLNAMQRPRRSFPLPWNPFQWNPLPWNPLQSKAHRTVWRWLRFMGLTLLACCLLITGLDREPALAQDALHYTELEFPPLPEITIPDYERFQLENGLTVYLMEDHELPLVGGSVLVHTGDRLEPADKVGLATMVGEGMRLGGSERFPADDLNMFLEQRAASIETGISTTSGSASFNSLKEDLREVFERFADVVKNPVFPPDKLALLQGQLEGSIARRNDDPDTIARREFNKLIYGENSPYARTVEYSTLAHISRNDVVAFHQRYFVPSNMLLGVYGDFDAGEMRSLIEQTFGVWSMDTPAAPDPGLPPLAQQVTQEETGGVFLVDQPQLTQSSVLIGHLGGQLDNPDYAALSVMNQVLNGLGGRLLNEVRSRQGLAYNVYAVWSANYDYPGVFIAGGQTRSEATVPFVNATLAELEKMRRAPITDAELAQAKDSVINSFVFNFQSPSQTLSRVVNYDFFDYPEDFIFQYRQAIEALTAEDVQQAAREHLNPDQMVTLVVGNAAAIAPPLSLLADGEPVTTLDITIPEPTPATVTGLS